MIAFRFVGRRALAARLAAVVCLSTFGLCADTDVEAPTEPVSPRDEAFESMERLTEVLLQVRRFYVEEKSYSEIVDGAIAGMLNSLDPHSAYLSPESYRSLSESTKGEFGGLGIRVGMRGGGLIVIAPIEDSPAFEAGLQSGDRIISIDGERTQGMSLADCVKRMRGPVGERVRLIVLSEDDEKPREVELVRAVIKVASVKGVRMMDKDIGYVRIVSFDERTGEDLLKALEQLKSQGMGALVLDLRDNPGGLLKSAIEVSQAFLPRGTLVVSRRSRQGSSPPIPSVARGRVRYEELPMVVLINGGSASASEIVAGALQDHKRAVLIGSTSFGKASVQTVLRLSNVPEGEQAAIRLTTAHYYTPSGRMIHDIGIDPDIPVHVPPREWRSVLLRRAHEEAPQQFDAGEIQEYADVVDRQLVRAVDLLGAIRIFQSRKD